MYRQMMTRSLTQKLFGEEEEQTSKNSVKSHDLEVCVERVATFLDANDERSTKKRTKKSKNQGASRKRKQMVDDSPRKIKKLKEFFLCLDGLCEEKLSQVESHSIEPRNGETSELIEECDLPCKASQRELKFDHIDATNHGSLLAPNSVDMSLDDSQADGVQEGHNNSTGSWESFLNCTEELPASPNFDTSTTCLDSSTDIWISEVLNSLTFDQTHLLELERSVDDSPCSEFSFDPTVWLQDAPLAFNFSCLSTFSERSENNPAQECFNGDPFNFMTHNNYGLSKLYDE